MKFSENWWKEEIIKAYISVMGIEKYNSLTETEKDELLHIVINDVAAAIL